MKNTRSAPAALEAPHKDIPVKTEREKFVLRLFDNLWARYRARVSYVRAYESVVRESGGKFVNDHIAFRTLAGQAPAAGIFTLARIFRVLGYTPRACYEFPDKHMSSVHLAHPNGQFPKLFITELKTWELSGAGQRIIRRVLKSHRPPLPDAVLADLHRLDQAAGPARTDRLLKTLIPFFAELPWDLPAKRDVIELDRESQFGAWVLLNGYDVNHFTASVNSHGVARLDDIEKTVEVLRRAAVPMKKEIEGARGSVLRQTSTESVILPFKVKVKSRTETLNWTYAYFEIAERGFVSGPGGARKRFEGFLGAQATHLFEMTKLAK